MRNKFILAVVAVAAIFCLTACENSNFNVKYSAVSEGVKIEVTAGSGVQYSSYLWPVSVIKEAGYTDVEAQKYDIVKDAVKRRPDLFTKTSGSQSVEVPYSRYEAGVDYVIYTWSYKGNDVDVVTCYKFTCK